MSFSNKDFSVMAYSNGFTLWNYVSEDSLSSIKEDGYFSPIAPFARAGDIIFASGGKGGEISTTILSIRKVDNNEVQTNNLSL